MRRRDFLRAGAAAAAGLAAREVPAAPAGDEDGADRPADPPGADAPAPAVEGRQPGAHLGLSLAAYSFRRWLGGDSPEMELEDVIDLSAREGLEATELTSYWFRSREPEYVVGLRRRASVNGLAVSGLPTRSDFCKEPGPERDRELEEVKGWVDRASLLGAQTLRIFAGQVPRSGSEREAVARAIDGLAELAEHAGRRGVLLALENHGGITSTADGLLGIVEGVDSPWLGVNLDTGNFHQDVWRSLERAAPRAVAVQVKVEVHERGKPPEPTDYERLARLLVDAGYRGYLALEYEAGGDAREEVPRHLARLRRAIA